LAVLGYGGSVVRLASRNPMLPQHDGQFSS
jgi:hypothetical protein